MTATYLPKTVKKKLPEYLLLPLSALYRIAILTRNKMFDWNLIRSHEFDLPVISIGNITAGGTGKTPVSEYLAEFLSKEYHVAVLSRGYKRKTKGYILASEGSGPEEIGDEPCQVKSKFPGIEVAVDEKRVRGIRKLMQAGAEVILLDDAFQHRYVRPGLSILLIDYRRPVTKDFLLPFGRLREPVSSINRANIILITKSPLDLKAIDMRIRTKDFNLNPFQHLYFTGVKAGEPTPVFREQETYTGFMNKPSALLVSGIAGPDGFTSLAGEFAAVDSHMHISRPSSVFCRRYSKNDHCIPGNARRSKDNPDYRKRFGKIKIVPGRTFRRFRGFILCSGPGLFPEQCCGPIQFSNYQLC